ncbi:MAG: insulinase family protein [Candidatus Eremiobacteraeota bacterium]|nr:insulinase family protein [Candidatus Eremiobacteraeota bacterium]MBC5803967.1 insulinase family protein [Candidatus Eremiobacteraeota bacterium]MBC5822526.1 insulinase family protein [Candidatus Eremiobacteraeota bacterium]
MSAGLRRAKALGLAAVLAGAASSAAAAPAPAPGRTLRFPTPSAVEVGPTRLIGEADPGALLSGVAIFIAAGLDRVPAARSGIASLTAECIIRTPVDGVPLREAVTGRGGSVNYTVDGRSVRYFLEGRSAELPALVTLLGKALAAPDFSAATVAAARAGLGGKIDQADADPLAVGIQMFRQAYYAASAGMPALGTAAGLVQLGPPELGAFYAATYKRRAVTASAVGSAVPQLAAALRTLAAALPDGPVAAGSERANALSAQAPRIVAHRDIAAPWVVLGFAAPSPDSPDFGPMLVLESLVADAFNRNSATTLGDIEKGVGAVYLYDAKPAGLVVYVNGTITDPSLALREVLVVSRSLAAKPVTAAALSRLKSSARGQFLADADTLSSRAYLLGAFSAQGLGDDPINAALAGLERTTPADLQRVAKRYLQRYIVALVLPRERAPGPGR